VPVLPSSAPHRPGVKGSGQRLADGSLGQAAVGTARTGTFAATSADQHAGTPPSSLT